jgi:hypothetical protein
MHRRQRLATIPQKEPGLTRAGSGSERASIFLARIVDRVVLAGHGEDVCRTQSGQHLLDLIELLGRSSTRLGTTVWSVEITGSHCVVD